MNSDFNPATIVDYSLHFTATKEKDGSYIIDFRNDKSQAVNLHTLPASVANQIRDLDKNYRPESPKREIQQITPQVLGKRAREPDHKSEPPAKVPCVDLVTEAEDETTEETVSPVATQQNQPIQDQPIQDQPMQDQPIITDAVDVAEVVQKAVEQEPLAPATSPQATLTLSRSIKHVVEENLVKRAGSTQVKYKVRPAKFDESPSDLHNLPPEIVEEVHRCDREESEKTT